MVNVSAAWHRTLFNDKRNFLERVRITLQDSTVLNLTNENIWSGGFSIEDAVSSDSVFQVGTAIVNRFDLTINNIYDTYSQYDFTNATVYVRVGLVTDESTEIIEKGLYTVQNATYNGSLIKLECLDYMSKFDRLYNDSTSGSNLTYPATLSEIIRDACTKCGLVLGTLNFPHSTYLISERPSDKNTTFREVIAWCAQIAGCFARMYVESGVSKLGIQWYDQSSLSSVAQGIDGGIFDSGSPYYSTGDNADGGTFNPWSEGDEVDGGLFTDRYNVHFIYSLYSKDISVDDVIITGVSILVKNEGDAEEPVETHTTGSNGYVVSIENNPLITTTNVDEILAWLGTQLVGFTFRKASISHGSDPSIEAGDVALVFDGKGNSYPIVVSHTKFVVGSPQQTISAAQTPERNSSVKFSAETRNYVEIHKAVEKEKSARELAEEAIRQQLASSNGLYYTSEPDPDDNNKRIYYLHNKANLSQSAIRIKFSEGGIAVTNNALDQTPSWYGLTVSGEMIVNLLASTGILFDWAQGGTLTLGGQGNDYGRLLIKNSQDSTIGSWDNSGINIDGGSIHISSSSSEVDIANGGITCRNSAHSLQAGLSSGGVYISGISGGVSLSDNTIAFYDSSQIVIDDISLTFNGNNGLAINSDPGLGLTSLSNILVSTTFGDIEIESPDGDINIEADGTLTLNGGDGIYLKRGTTTFATFTLSSTDIRTPPSAPIYLKTTGGTNIATFSNSSGATIYGNSGDVLLDVGTTETRLKYINNTTRNTLALFRGDLIQFNIGGDPVMKLGSSGITSLANSFNGQINVGTKTLYVSHGIITGYSNNSSSSSGSGSGEEEPDVYIPD